MKDLSMKHFLSNTKSVLNADPKEEYKCVLLQDYLCEVKLPTPFLKKKGIAMVLLTSGEIEVKIGKDELNFTAGEVLIVQPLKAFSIHRIVKPPQGIVLYIKSNSMLGTMGSHSMIFNLDFLEIWSESRYKIEKKMFPYFENIFQRIYFESQYTNDLAIVNAYTITLLLELNCVSSNSNEIGNAAISLTHRFKKEIYSSLNQQLSISDYSERLSVSTNHLNKAVKTAIGLTAGQLIGKIKIIEAKYLLFRSEYTIADIAENLGFEDPSYFSRFFKKLEKVTPNEYRKLIDLS